MDARQFAALARVEREHWFYRGKRDLVRHWIATFARPAPRDLLLDVGAGTGGFLADVAPAWRAVGVEWHPAALAMAARTGVPIVGGVVERLPVRDGCAAVVTALDVIEHVDDDVGAVHELARATRPGGLIVLHVPAFACLWSAWDEALGHRRRYTRAALVRLVEGCSLTVRHCAYVNAAVFLPVLLYRRLRDRLPRRPGPRLEDAMPPAALNRLLHALYVVPGRWRWLAPPIGVSVLCVAQKPGP